MYLIIGVLLLNFILPCFHLLNPSTPPKKRIVLFLTELLMLWVNFGDQAVLISNVLVIFLLDKIELVGIHPELITFFAISYLN